MRLVRFPLHLFAILGFAWASGAQNDTDALPSIVFPIPPPPPAPPADLGPFLTEADFASYFAEGTLAEAKVAFDRRQYAKARELLKEVDQTAPTRFLSAHAAYLDSDFASAAPAFEQLAESYLALRDFCLLQAGLAYEKQSAFQEAERAFRAVDAASSRSVDAQLGLARVSLAQKKPVEALEVLNLYADGSAPPWGRDVSAEALVLKAAALMAQGDRQGERAAWLKLYSEHPLAREARLAQVRLGDLSMLPVEAKVARAAALIEGHRNAEGVAVLEPLAVAAKLPGELACRLHFALGKAYRKLRKHRQAIATLTPVAAQCTEPQLRAKALFTLGTSQSIVAKAIAPRTFEELAQRFPRDALADDALLAASELYWSQGDATSALERLRTLVEDVPRGDLVGEALFKLFWIHRKQGRLDEAIGFLKELEGRCASGDSAQIERAVYWRGQTLAQQGKADEASALLTSLAQEHPGTYYGLLARERVEALTAQLGERGEPAAVLASASGASPFPVSAGALADVPSFWSAVEFLRLGLPKYVRSEIQAIERDGLPDAAVRLLVLVLSKAKEERVAQGLARLWLQRDLNGRIDAERRSLWEIAFPLAYRDEVLKAAREADDLDPDLLQALMREESALDPQALSWAGALGLCQLMPLTAAEVASRLKLPRPTKAQLFDPQLNLRLGARYLSDLLRRASGIKSYALAAYNAGEGSVSRWRRDLGDQPLDEWVEEIPLQETRGYVKRVLRSYNTYKLLYAPTQRPSTVTPVVDNRPTAPPAG